MAKLINDDTFESKMNEIITLLGGDPTEVQASGAVLPTNETFQLKMNELKGILSFTAGFKLFAIRDEDLASISLQVMAFLATASDKIERKTFSIDSESNPTAYTNIGNIIDDIAIHLGRSNYLQFLGNPATVVFGGVNGNGVSFIYTNAVEFGDNQVRLTLLHANNEIRIIVYKQKINDVT